MGKINMIEAINFCKSYNDAMKTLNEATSLLFHSYYKTEQHEQAYKNLCELQKKWQAEYERIFSNM